MATTNSRLTDNAILASRSNREERAFSSDRSSTESKLLSALLGNSRKSQSHEDDMLEVTKSSNNSLIQMLKVMKSFSSSPSSSGKTSNNQVNNNSNKVFSDRSSHDQSMIEELIKKNNTPDDVASKAQGFTSMIKGVNLMSVVLQLVEKLVGTMADSMNRYATAFENTLPQMVSTMSQTQSEYKDLILGTNNLIISAGTGVTKYLAKISDASATMTVLANNTLMTNISMIELIDKSYTKLSGKGITGSNISELAIYDQLFELIAYGFDVTSQNNLESIRLYGNQTAIMSAASYISIRNQLNSLFGDTQYLLNGIYHNTTNLSQTAFNSYTDQKLRIEAEHEFQRTLAVMYESGVSSKTVENWSTALTSLMSGDLGALSSDAGASLLLALKNSGVEISKVVSGAMSGDDVRTMLISMIESAKNAVDGNYNMIYKNAIANILGTDVQTLSSNRLEEALEILKFTQSEDSADLLRVLNESVSKAGESLTIEQKMKNSVDNIAVNMTTGFVSLGSGIIGTMTSLGSAILVGMTALALSNMSVMGNNVGAPIATALIAVTAVAGIIATIASAAKGMNSMTQQFQESNEKLGLNISLEEQGMSTIDYEKLATTLSDSNSSTNSVGSSEDTKKDIAEAAETESKNSDNNNYAKSIYNLLNEALRSGDSLKVKVTNQESSKDYSDKLDKICENLITINSNIVGSYTSFNMESATSNPLSGRSIEPVAVGGGF